MPSGTITSLSPPDTTMSGVWPARAHVSVPRVEIDHGVGHRDEAAIVEMLGEQAVDLDQQLPRRSLGVAQREHQPLQLGHVQRGGRALARDVGDQHAELPRAELEEVVVVAADLARRLAEVRDVEAGDARRLDRQQRLLNLARDAQLVVEPLLLALHVQQVLDARAHAVERLGQIAELVARLDA